MASQPFKSERRDHGVLTVMSANLWHDWPFRRRLPHRLEAFAQLVEKEGADVVLLQEVIRAPQIQADDWLGKRLNMAFVYSRVNGDEEAIGFEEGLAVLSRFPLMDAQMKNLGAGEGLYRRMALAVEVHSPFGELWAISVHLGFIKRRNQSQWRDLRRWINGLGGDRSALIGGDFNANEHSTPIRQAQRLWIDTYRSVNPEGDGATHELRLPWGNIFRRRLDYIFLRPGSNRWRVMDTRHVLPSQEPHSDHCAVITRCSPLNNSSSMG
jgi:endonuclease/exonuclease/phosphatase family metal-dependent hydrolase